MEQATFLINSLGKACEALAGAGIPYALAGGLAFSALVEPRATVDIDLLVLASDTSPERLLRALSSRFDSLLPHAEPMAFKTATIWRVVAVLDGRELVLDFLLGEDDFCREALRRRQQANFLGHKIWLVTLEDLYIFKRRADRPQDRVDIDTIERLKGPLLDRPYIQRWAGQ